MARLRRVLIVGEEGSPVSERCVSQPCPIFKEFIKKDVKLVNVEEELKRVMIENRKYKQDIVQLIETIRELFEPISAVINLFNERLSKISIVDSAYYFIRDDTFDIWTIIKKEDFEQELKLAETECELMRIFRNLKFDFMTLPKYDQKVEDIIPEGGTKIYP